MPASAIRHFSGHAVLATFEVASTIEGLVKQRTATPVFSGLSRIERFRDGKRPLLVMQAMGRWSCGS